MSQAEEGTAIVRSPAANASAREEYRDVSRCTSFAAPRFDIPTASFLLQGARAHRAELEIP